MIEHLKQDRWFVDVRGNIRGPSSSWDIIQQLIAGQLKVIHRVSRDRENWKGICNEEYFENAVNTAIDHYTSLSGGTGSKNLSDDDDDENTGFGNLSGISAGIQSQLDHAQNLQEINVGLNSLRKLRADIIHNRKVVIEARQDAVDEIHPDDRNVYVGMETEANQGFFARHKLLSSVLVFGFFALAGLKYLEYQDLKEARAIAEKVKQMKKEKALEGYEKALSGTEKLSSAELITLAQEEIGKNNMAFGERLLRQALDIAEYGPEKAKAHSLLGYIATRDNDLEKAAKAYEASIENSQELYVSYHNFGVLKLRAQLYEDAEVMFLKALEIKTGPKDRTPTYFGLMEAAIELDKKENAKAEKEQLENKKPEDKEFQPKYPRLDKAAVLLARASVAYQRESLLAENYISFLRENGKINRPKLLEFLKLDDSKIKEKPIITGQDMSRVDWNHLYSWCLALYNHDRKSVQLNTLFGYCVYRARGAKAAKPYLDFAVAKGSHDPIHRRYQKIVENDLKAAKSESTSASKSN